MSVAFWTFLFLLAGCGEKAPVKQQGAATPKPPRITQFYGAQAVVAKGGSLTLCYGTENVETLALSPSADGDLRPSLNRCVAEIVTHDTTFTLTAKGPGGSTSATFSVRIGPPAPKNRVLITSFVLLGKRELCYTTEGASAVHLEPSPGAALTPGKNRCLAVAPVRTTNYVLTATAPDGSVDRMQVNVPVQ